ncbi:MAG TPA: PRC-barrel domain-containing protein [Devosia sp.]|nr:PRC-barrel domain-containing protein [Devosia sp.]
MRHILIAPALALLLTLPATAQDAAPAPATTAPSELEQSGLTPPTVLSQGYAADDQDVLVTKLLGQKVYSSVADNAREIGTINNMVITSGMGISAVVIAVGGFLGVGEKDVAVDFAELTWAERDDGTRRWVLETTQEELAEAPAFIWTDSEESTGKPALTTQQEQNQLVDGNPNATPLDPSLTTDQPERPVITTTPDRSGMTNVNQADLSADDLRGIPVYGRDDEQIGTISDVVLTPQGNSDALIIDVGGFLGLGAKPVAVAFENLTFSSDTNGQRYLFLNTSREQLETQPEYDPQTYETERNSQRMVVTP